MRGEEGPATRSGDRIRQPAQAQIGRSRRPGQVSQLSIRHNRLAQPSFYHRSTETVCENVELITPMETKLSQPGRRVWQEKCLSFADGHDGNGVSRELPAGFFNWEDVESATQSLSKANLRGKSNFCAVYRGILKDGSVVAVKSIKVGCCKSEEAGLMKGLSLLTSLRHKNLVAERFFAVRRAGANIFSSMKGKLYTDDVEIGEEEDDVSGRDYEIGR
ncbi:hypothetical protein U1Q18_031628 [Sarracenia purpurea var. burkii]